MEKNDHQLCVYCQVTEADTEDHVPGKQFFPAPKPTPSELVAVPACSACNTMFQPVENYIRSILMFSNAGSSDAGKKLWDQKLKRTFQKDLGLRKLMSCILHPIQTFTPEGLYAGQRLAINADWSRVDQFITKLIKGLYFHEYNEPLPSTAFLDVSHEHFKFGDSFLSQYIELSKHGKNSWPGVFEYRHNRLEDVPEKSLWMFLLYGHIVWFAFTITEEMCNNKNVEQNNGQISSESAFSDESSL